MIKDGFFLSCVNLVVILSVVDAANILAVIPASSISHQVVFRPLTQELAKRGHDVTVITTDPVFSSGNTPPNLKEIDLHDVSYRNLRKILNEIITSTDIISQSRLILETMSDLFEIQLKTAEVLPLLYQTKEFDLLILEALARPALVFSHIFKAPVIAMSSFGSVVFNNDAMGVPTHPLLYPVAFHQRLNNLTKWEKIKEIYNHVLFEWYVDRPMIKYENAMLKRVFGPVVPSLHELYNNIDMLFLNIHSMWMGNVPLPPSVINIWGIHERMEKELSEDLKSYLDSSKHGVIYMSFGTNVMPSMLPAKMIQAFVKVFAELPYHILWKWDKEELPGKSENIRISKWFPQSDLLKHPKLKLFITQGGLQSTEEAITAGVPMVGVPVLGDQWYNVEKYEHFKIGKRLDLDALTENDVRLAVHAVLSDDSYRQNIVKLRSLLADQPQTALERAVWWTEHVLRHSGAKHLRAPAANMSWAEYYEIELVATVFISLTLIVFVVILSLRFLIKSVLTQKLKVKRKLPDFGQIFSFEYHHRD